MALASMHGSVKLWHHGAQLDFELGGKGKLDGKGIIREYAGIYFKSGLVPLHKLVTQGCRLLQSKFRPDFLFCTMLNTSRLLRMPL
jgi:hypothetical protein